MESGQIDNNNTGAGAGGAGSSGGDLERLGKKDTYDFINGLVSSVFGSVATIFRKTPDKIEINTDGGRNDIIKYIIWFLLGGIFLFLIWLVVRSFMKMARGNNNSKK